MILHDLDAIYYLVMTFFKSCPMAGMTTVDHVVGNSTFTIGSPFGKSGGIFCATWSSL